MIDCEHIMVFTFDGSLSVSTFRTVTLPKDMENYKNELEKQYLAKLLEKEKNKELEQGSYLELNFYIFLLLFRDFNQLKIGVQI